jgi:hypothetical protein
MLVRLLAAIAFVAVAFRLLRFALGLRAQMRSREEERRAQEARGRSVVAELPLEDGVALFLEDAAGFYWGGSALAKAELRGARLALNGGVVAQAARPGFELPPPGAAAEFDGSEQWEVALFATDGGARRVACGRLREGVSRDAAGAVYAAAKRALGA